MCNRPLCGMALAMICGILYVSSKQWYYFMAAIIFCVVIAGQFIYEKKWGRGILYIALLAIAFLGGMSRYHKLYANRQSCCEYAMI